MLPITKKLLNIGGSKAVVLPDAWLKQFPGIVEVLLCVDAGEVLVKPSPNSVTANLRTLKEVSKC
jgi:hypothetical protein